MSTLYYAVGGGLGHITRAQRVVRTLEIADAIVITSSSAEIDLPLIHVDEADSIVDIIQRTAAERLIVDAFPVGIRGELAAVRMARIDYVARRLRWSSYRQACPEDARFHTAYVVEELEDEHRRWIEANCENIEPLDLAPPARSEAMSDFWLIVHSGPADEVRELIDYTQELATMNGPPSRVLVATRCEVDLPAGFERTDGIPYASAARIISAAGFNVMLETESWAAKHYVVPFPRRFDDQFARAAIRRRRLCG